MFDIDKTHLELTICLKHRDLFGVRWRSNKKNSAAPSSWCSLLSRERGISLSRSVTILSFLIFQKKNKIKRMLLSETVTMTLKWQSQPNVGNCVARATGVIVVCHPSDV